LQDTIIEAWTASRPYDVGVTRSRSPLADALSRVGDRWSLLVIDALLDGPARFADLSRSVPGIAPNILAQRLRHLQVSGVVLSEPYSQRPLRHTYRLSEEGQELAGVVRLLASWGGGTGMGQGLHHSACGTAMEARWYCPTCTRVVEEEDSTDLRQL
jgi:DNA-binding HxlR family transcriptional regulator